MARVVWTLYALDRLEAITNYIETDAPGYVPVFLRRVFELAESAGQFPYMGRRVPEFPADDTLREIIFHNYRIVYRIVADDVRVLTVRHSAMDPRTLAADISAGESLT